jgi:hypothetical protein
MKTIKTKMILMFFGLMVMKHMQSQSLTIFGRITNLDGKEISATYELLCSDGTTYSGFGCSIKERLQLNSNYTITFSRLGYKSKTLSISTYVNKSKNYNMRFGVELEESDKGGPLHIKVSYNSEKNSFNYHNN